MVKHKQVARASAASSIRRGWRAKSGGRGTKTAQRAKSPRAAKAELRAPMTWAEWALMGMVLAAALAIGLALSVQLLDSPAERAQKRMSALADDYYVEFLYPRLTNGGAETEKLVDYAKSGVPMTYLRQLLHYNNGEHAEEAEIFETAGCDTNATGVRYYPVEPYGPRDYTASFVWQCDIME